MKKEVRTGELFRVIEHTAHWKFFKKVLYYMNSGILIFFEKYDTKPKSTRAAAAAAALEQQPFSSHFLSRPQQYLISQDACVYIDLYIKCVCAYVHIFFRFKSISYLHFSAAAFPSPSLLVIFSTLSPFPIPCQIETGRRAGCPSIHMRIHDHQYNSLPLCSHDVENKWEDSPFFCQEIMHKNGLLNYAENNREAILSAILMKLCK